MIESIKVKKRDGRVVPFDSSKIRNAVQKAFKEVGVENDLNAAEYIERKIISYALNEYSDDSVPIGIEDIQDWVEDALLDFDRKTAKAYITYRYKRKLVRDNYNSLMEGVHEKITAQNVQNQNANVDEYSFGGRVGETSDFILKQYALNNCMSEMSKNNHLNNEIYIHDLSAYAVGMHNCLSIPFDDLLANGFTTRQVDIRPAQSVNTAFQLVAVIFQIQSLQQFGGVSATHLDWTMIPYVRKSFYKHFKDGALYLSTPAFYKWYVEEYAYLKEAPKDAHISLDKFKEYIINHCEIDSDDKLDMVYQYAIDMTVKEIYQAVEGMYHNLNSLQSRSGNQLPFSSINYGTCTLKEGRLVTKALLDVSIKGVGKLHKTSIFPCGIFQCMEGVNRKPDDPNYDLFRLALKSTAKRLYPNYANTNWSGNAGYDINDPRTYFSTINKSVA